jgi:histone acetyltransferase 1
MVFTIDGASFLDKDDPQWEVVLAVKQVEGQQQSLVGIMTLYNFYAWVPGQVGSHRPRVAQILVVPPYQGQGMGHRLLTTAYDLARQRDTRPLTVSVHIRVPMVCLLLTRHTAWEDMQVVGCTPAT